MYCEQCDKLGFDKCHCSYKALVSAYIACGKKAGFAKAEFILMKFLPDDRLEGKCSDVPRENIIELITSLEAVEAGQASPQQGVKAELIPDEAKDATGKLVAVAHWGDFDLNDATKLGILARIEDGYFYVEGDNRAYRHCRIVGESINITQEHSQEPGHSIKRRNAHYHDTGCE